MHTRHFRLYRSLRPCRASADQQFRGGLARLRERLWTPSSYGPRVAASAVTASTIWGEMTTPSSRRYYRDAVLKKLFAHSRNSCAFPRCEEVLSKPEWQRVLAEICHITGLNVGSARHDPTTRSRSATTTRACSAVPERQWSRPKSGDTRRRGPHDPSRAARSRAPSRILRSRALTNRACLGWQ